MTAENILPPFNANDFESNENNGETKSNFSLEIKKLLRIILLAFILALIIKSFFIEANQIPTASMENTLLVGDFIIINKAAYRLATPSDIPFTNITIPSLTLFSVCHPQRNDVIVFHFPGYQNEVTPAENENYIKRIAGLPGDTIQITNGIVYVNHKQIPLPPHALRGRVITSEILSDDRIYPSGKAWNSDNYGPIIVPFKGMKIKISPQNIDEWKILIDREFNHEAVSVEGTVITINGIPERDYTIKKDYYFVLGDNREDSMDSRYWGFVPDNLIVGKAIMIYWSQYKSNTSAGLFGFINQIRFKRIFSVIH